jgi:predicted metal-dependent phosphoesterase TrpH
MLKTDLHIHTGDDPVDFIPYSTVSLIDRAADLGYQALAITLHERQLDVARFRDYARERGIVLVAGVERTIQGKHVLLLNFPARADQIDTFEQLAALKACSDGLVIAPHPFFPAPSCLHSLLDRHAALFDAIELNYFYTKHLDFNRRAARWARAHGKPVVANTDVHRLRQLGPTYSLVDSEPDPAAVCAAIRAGRVEIRTEPIPVTVAAEHFVRLTLSRLRAPCQPYPLPAPGDYGALVGHSK